MPNHSLPQFLRSTILPSLAAVSAIGLPLATSLPASAASLTPVDLELSLLVDVSGSINSREYALQMGGYKDAFTKLSSQFGPGGFGSVAVNLIQWGNANSQQQSIPWTLLNDRASALQFANTIGALARFSTSSTAPGSALRFATPLFSSNDYDGQRWVIDVSGDGIENSGISTRLARDNALSAGVTTINGLPIVVGSNTSVETWYRNNIQGGTGSFVLAADGFEDFGRAIEQKLLLELTPPSAQSAAVPEPTTMLGVALAGGGLAWFKRRRQPSV